jgi:hypothetical protein
MMTVDLWACAPQVPDPNPFEIEIATENLKRHKSPGSEKILAEVIQAGGETLLCEIHKLINSIWNKEELPYQCKESIIVSFYKKGDKTDCSNYSATSLLSASDSILYNILL